jgi:formylglycine-generating enzyme required for sulfatase activity
MIPNITDEQQRKLDQLKKAFDLGDIDRDTYQTVVAAINLTQTSSGINTQDNDAARMSPIDTEDTEDTDTRVGGNAHDINTGTINYYTYLYYQGGGQEHNEEKLKRQIVAYLKWLAEKSGRIVVRGINQNGAPVSLDLDIAYVPLLARLPIHREDLFHKSSEWAITPIDSLRAAIEEREIEIEKALTLGSRLAIIGGPGSGKTTVLNHIAWALALVLLYGGDVAHKRLGLWGQVPIPILLPLYAYAEHLRGMKGKLGVPASEYRLSTYITEYFTEHEAIPNLPQDFFTALMVTGRDVIVLLDGLDEVADEDERSRVTQAIEDLVAGKDNLRVIVTCRATAYYTGRTSLVTFRVITIQPLDPFDIERQIAPMVRNAYACIYQGQPALIKSRSEDLIVSITKLEYQRRERLGASAEPLTTSPLMVRMLLIVHYDNRILPPDRAELYEKAVEALIKSDHETDPTKALALHPKDIGPDLHLAMAQYLAYSLHKKGENQGREIDGAALNKLYAEQEIFASHGDELIKYAHNRGGLIEENYGRYRFMHLGFQEFLVARYLKEVIGSNEGLDAILERVGDKNLSTVWWREPVLLLCGYTAAKSPEAASTLLRKLAVHDQSLGGNFATAELAAVAAVEWRYCPDSLCKEIANGLVNLLANRDLCITTPPELRMRAGRLLSQLGDPRKGIGLGVDNLPDIDWLLIPNKGEFVYGEGNTERKLRLPTYKISRYPITKAQFQAFIEANDGFHNPLSWKGLAEDKVHRSAAGMQQFDFASNPRDNVNWYDAVAFCAWLSARTHTTISLPTEQQWEKAARGQDGRNYPWGNEYIPGYANIDETHLSAGPSRLMSTSPVGIYPQGKSPYEVMDLSGNVWEWCLNKGNNTEDTGLDNGQWRVVRGGSWSESRESTCCWSRGGFAPTSRGSGIGFRVVQLVTVQ